MAIIVFDEVERNGQPLIDTLGVLGEERRARVDAMLASLSHAKLGEFALLLKEAQANDDYASLDAFVKANSTTTFRDVMLWADDTKIERVLDGESIVSVASQPLDVESLFALPAHLDVRDGGDELASAFDTLTLDTHARESNDTTRRYDGVMRALEAARDGDVDALWFVNFKSERRLWWERMLKRTAIHHLVELYKTSEMPAEATRFALGATLDQVFNVDFLKALETRHIDVSTAPIVVREVAYFLFIYMNLIFADMDAFSLGEAVESTVPAEVERRAKISALEKWLQRYLTVEIVEATTREWLAVNTPLPTKKFTADEWSSHLAEFVASIKRSFHIESSRVPPVASAGDMLEDFVRWLDACVHLRFQRVAARVPLVDATLFGNVETATVEERRANLTRFFTSWLSTTPSEFVAYNTNVARRGDIARPQRIVVVRPEHGAAMVPATIDAKVVYTTRQDAYLDGQDVTDNVSHRFTLWRAEASQAEFREVGDAVTLTWPFVQRVFSLFGYGMYYVRVELLIGAKVSAVGHSDLTVVLEERYDRRSRCDVTFQGVDGEVEWSSDELPLGIPPALLERSLPHKKLYTPIVSSYAQTLERLRDLVTPRRMWQRLMNASLSPRQRVAIVADGENHVLTSRATLYANLTALGQWREMFAAGSAEVARRGGEVDPQPFAKAIVALLQMAMRILPEMFESVELDDRGSTLQTSRFAEWLDNATLEQLAFVVRKNLNVSRRDFDVKVSTQVFSFLSPQLFTALEAVENVQLPVRRGEFRLVAPFTWRDAPSFSTSAPAAPMLRMFITGSAEALDDDDFAETPLAVQVTFSSGSHIVRVNDASADASVYARMQAEIEVARGDLIERVVAMGCTVTSTRTIMTSMTIDGPLMLRSEPPTMGDGQLALDLTEPDSFDLLNMHRARDENDFFNNVTVMADLQALGGLVGRAHAFWTSRIA